MIKLTRWNPEKREYEAVMVSHSVKDATKRYNDAVKSGDRGKIIEACAIMNAIRKEAGLTTQAC